MIEWKKMKKREKVWVNIWQKPHKWGQINPKFWLSSSQFKDQIFDGQPEYVKFNKERIVGIEEVSGKRQLPY